MYPRNWWDPRWEEISAKASEIQHEIYHQSIFEVIELNCPEIDLFRQSCGKLLKELKNPTSDLHVRIACLLHIDNPVK